MVQNSITTTRTYNDAGQMLKESYSGGILNGLVITNQYIGANLTVSDSPQVENDLRGMKHKVILAKPADTAEPK